MCFPIYRKKMLLLKNVILLKTLIYSMWHIDREFFLFKNKIAIRKITLNLLTLFIATTLKKIFLLSREKEMLNRHICNEMLRHTRNIVAYHYVDITLTFHNTRNNGSLQSCVLYFFLSNLFSPVIPHIVLIITFIRA